MKKDKTQLLKENEALFQETLNEFSDKTYDLASVNEIIKRSKFNKGSFYYRFKDKFELYIALINYIYVTQIDVFRQKGIRLNDLTKIDEIIELMFVNQIELYKLDNRYYNVLQYLYSDDKELIDRVNQTTIQSLYQRFLIKLKSNNQFNRELEEIIKALYINFPVKKIFNKEIDIDYLFKLISPNSNFNSKTKELKNNNDFSLYYDILNNCNNIINYFVGDFSSKDFSVNDYNLFSKINNINKYKRMFKIKNMNPFFNTKKALKKYKNKPIFNHLAVNKLLEDRFYNQIEEDNLLMNISFLLVYAIIELNEYIVLNDFVKHLTPKQLDLLFDIILPITGKLSKIIILDYHLYQKETNLISYYIINSIDNINKLNQNINFMEAKKIYNLKYKKNNNYYNEYFEDYKDIISLINSGSIDVISIQTVNSLSYLELIESR